MNRSTLRTLGIACIVIGSGYTLMDRMNLDEPLTSNAQEFIEYEEKIAQLEQQLTEAQEQITILEKMKQDPAENTNEQKTTEEVTSSPKTEVTTNDVVEATLHIYSGLTVYDISKKLEDLGIVENALEMELFLAKPEYARSIQIGQYELTSAMTIEEIANMITGKMRMGQK
nr:hypothetical protein [Lysinibacillus timonensis]